jgi:DNA-binding NtrC family response regulator
LPAACVVVTRSLALVADSDETRRRSLGVTLAGIGCHVREVVDVGQLPADACRFNPNLIVLALSTNDGPKTFTAIAELRARDQRLPILVVVRSGSETLAVEALRAGVKDYLKEPFEWPMLAASARRCLAAAESRSSARSAAPHAPSGPVVVVGASMRRIADYLARVAEHDPTVLITGETGTGKELAASLIHDLSRRRQARFVSINCAAIPEGLLESELFGHESGAFTGATARREGLLQAAAGGTVFLDEIGDMGPQGQAKILRAIDAREVYRVGAKRPERLDVRVIAATNHDLERAVEDGRFRKDLYFRLAVARVHLPPLRERRSDIGALLDHYLQQLNRERARDVEGFADEARAALEQYDWPGNVRELKNLIEAIFVSPPSRPITLADLPESFRGRLHAAVPASEAERRRLLDALLATNWNKSRAATMLQWSRMTVYRKMLKYSVARSTPSPRLRRQG